MDAKKTVQTMHCWLQKGTRGHPQSIKNQPKIDAKIEVEKYIEKMTSRPIDLVPIFGQKSLNPFIILLKAFKGPLKALVSL